MRKMIKRLVINSLVMIMMLVSVTVGATDTEFVNNEDGVNSTNAVNYVNDYAGLLTSDETSALERQICEKKPIGIFLQ